MFAKAPRRLVNQVIAELRKGRASSGYVRNIHQSSRRKVPELWLFDVGVWAPTDGRNVLVAYNRTDAQWSALDCASGYFTLSRLGGWRIRRAMRAWENGRG